jgi:hypothetical protein
MPNFEWVLKSESDTEKIYRIKNSTAQYIQVCSPGANYQLNERLASHKQNIKVGFYLIRDIHQQKKYKTEVNEEVARISYKENPDRKFVDMGMSVKIQPLFNYVSECLNGFKSEFKKDPTGLVGQIIHVQSSELVDSTFNDQTFKVNRVNWAILNYVRPPNYFIYNEEIDPEEFFNEEYYDPDEFLNEEDFDPEDYYIEEGIDAEEDFLQEDLDPDELLYEEDFDLEADFDPEAYN